MGTGLSEFASERQCEEVNANVKKWMEVEWEE